MIKQGFKYLWMGTKLLSTGIFLLIWKYTKLTAKFVNKLVYKYPWFFLIVTVIVSVLISYVKIGNARIERDEYQQQAYQVQKELNQLKILESK